MRLTLPLLVRVLFLSRTIKSYGCIFMTLGKLWRIWTTENLIKFWKWFKTYSTYIHRCLCEKLKWSWNKSSAVAEIGWLFGHNRHRQRSGGDTVSLSVGELGPHLTQCGLGQGLPPYQVASRSIQPFGHNRYGPRIGGCAPFWGARSPSDTMSPGPWPTKWHFDPSNRFATIHQRHRQNRTDNNSIARTIYKQSPKNQCMKI